MTQPDAQEPSCSQCQITRGELSPYGVPPLRQGPFIVHARPEPGAVAEWLIVAPARHVEQLDDLTPEEQTALGPLVAATAAALRAQTACEKVYVAVFAEVVQHLHVHVIARAKDAPMNVRGPAVFAALPPVSTEATAQLARAVLGRMDETSPSRIQQRHAFDIRPIAQHDDPQVAHIIRTVLEAFGGTGPGFAIHDVEVDAMTRSYSVAGAGYLVIADAQDLAVGGAGFAPLCGGPAGTCELRKMYFLPQVRGLGLGRKLLQRVLAAARAAGYTVCYLETLERMTAARALYESEGFVPLAGPCGATGHFACDAWYAKTL